MNPSGLKKILTVPQIRSADQHLINKSNISSWELMEVATSAFFDALMGHNMWRQRVLIFCGVGNNGGDGFALCRMLRKKGIYARAVLVKFKDELSPDCKSNYEMLDDVLSVEEPGDIPNLELTDVIVDSLLGTGLSRPIDGLLKKVVESINTSGKRIVSIDIPTGIGGDELIEKGSLVVQADLVISFQRPKLAFFYPEHGSFIKNWEVVNIGLDEKFMQSRDSNNFWLDERVKQLVKNRPRVSHKGHYGHALLMVGSEGKMGAAILAAKACLRSGVGLLTTQTPKFGNSIMQIAVPESMSLLDHDSSVLSSLYPTEDFDAIGIGPGIGQEKLTQILLDSLIKGSNKPLVLDADALNILSKKKVLLKSLPAQTILTPHVGEFKRLIGSFKNSMERNQKLSAFAVEHNCIVVLKDAYSVIADSNGALYFNSTGNQGMATGGSGDVLTGMITSLLAQGYRPLESAIIGVYFHGKAGDLAAKKRGHHALIASDIIDHIQIDRFW